MEKEKILINFFCGVYKFPQQGDNVSSTKEKRNTYPPLFSRLRCQGVPRPIFLIDRKLCPIKQNSPGDAHFAPGENGCRSTHVYNKRFAKSSEVLYTT